MLATSSPRHRLLAIVSAIITAVGTRFARTAPPDPDDSTIHAWQPAVRAAQLDYESLLNNTLASADSIRRLHDLLASSPHIAGTPGDACNVARIARAFADMGLEVTVHESWVYLARPIDAALEITSPEKLLLSVREEVLPTDPPGESTQLSLGWNAYSASGDVTAEVVYANYARKEDFQVLLDMGVDVHGKIVIARYGGAFRGCKAFFAQQAGAAGLILYTDPADAGAGRGPAYPDGPFPRPTYIQRGSILTLPYIGDPLTPFHESTRDADRLDPDSIALPKIPVQPVGWASASEILSRMTGPVESPPPWRGGLPIPYRLTSGPDLKVRLMVKQERETRPVWNVLGTLRGARHPDQMVLIGSHHDAWVNGAADPLSGTIVTLETARCFAEAARLGHRPDRSLVFCTWDAEEFGIIGSVEWVESQHDRLFKNAVAYLNLDAAAMGPQFSPAVAPSLLTVVMDAARYVIEPAPFPPPLPASTPDAAAGATTTAPAPISAPRTVFASWLARSQAASTTTEPRAPTPGGGSDHVGFYCHLAIPSAGFGATGSVGSAYHSLHDTTRWYRLALGEDYASPLMLARLANITLARLAAAPLLPLDFRRYGSDIREHCQTISKRAIALGLSPQITDPVEVAPNVRLIIIPELLPIIDAARAYDARTSAFHARLIDAMNLDRLSDSQLDRLNAGLIALDRTWFDPSGLDGRPWFRNLFAAPDEDTSYDTWALPALRRAVEHNDRAALTHAVGLYVGVLNSLSTHVDSLNTILDE